MLSARPRPVSEARGRYAIVETRCIASLRVDASPLYRPVQHPPRRIFCHSQTKIFPHFDKTCIIALPIVLITPPNPEMNPALCIADTHKGQGGWALGGSLYTRSGVSGLRSKYANPVSYRFSSALSLVTTRWSKETSLPWYVRAYRSAAASLPWYVRAYRSAAASLPWYVRAYRSAAASLPWYVRAYRSAAASLPWYVRAYRSATASLPWYVRAYRSAAASLPWYVRAYRSAAASLPWYVRAYRSAADFLNRAVHTGHGARFTVTDLN
jgi:hypothetical protein